MGRGSKLTGIVYAYNALKLKESSETRIDVLRYKGCWMHEACLCDWLFSTINHKSFTLCFLLSLYHRFRVRLEPKFSLVLLFLNWVHLEYRHMILRFFHHWLGRRDLQVPQKYQQLE